MRTVKRIKDKGYSMRCHTIYSNDELILEDAVPAEISPDKNGWYRVIVLDGTKADVIKAIRNRYYPKINKAKSDQEQKRYRTAMEIEVENARASYKADTYLYKDGIWYTGSEDNHEKAITAAKKYKYQIEAARSETVKAKLQKERDARINAISRHSSAKPVIAYARQPIDEYWNGKGIDKDSAVRLISANIEATLKSYKTLLERREPVGEKAAKNWREAVRQRESEIRDQLKGYSTNADPEEVIEQYREKYGGIIPKRKRKLSLRKDIPGKVDLTEAKRKIAEANAKSTGKKADPLKWSVFGGTHEDH